MKLNLMLILFLDLKQILIMSEMSVISADIDEVLDQLIKKNEDLKDTNFLLKGVESITYSFTKIIVKNTFIESPDWIKNKKCTINSQNKDNKCFQYSIIISFYHKKIKNNPERISKIKPFINNLNWENINFPPEQHDYKIFEMNNKSIALDILQVNEEKISHFYKSEFNKTREKQVILLMINDAEKQRYLAAKRLNGRFKKKTGHSGECCLNCLKLFVNKSSFQIHKC